jgi:hypothetical protein
MADLVAVQQLMAASTDPNAPLIDLSTLPEMTLRKVALKLAKIMCGRNEPFVTGLTSA